MDDFVRNFQLHIRAAYPALVINTPEETRCLETLQQAGWLMFQSSQHTLTQEILSVLRDWAPGLLDDAAGTQNDNLTFTFSSQALLRAYREVAARLDASNGDRNATRGLVAAKAALRNLLNAGGYPVLTYSMTEGWAHLPEPLQCRFNFEDALRLLQEDVKCERFPQRCLLVCKDLHIIINNDPLAARRLRDLVEGAPQVAGGKSRILVFLQPDWTIPADLRHCLTTLDYPLPSLVELQQVVSNIVQSPSLRGASETCDGEMIHAMAQAMLGFTELEASNAVYCAVAEQRRLTPAVVHHLHRLKAEVFKSDDVLTYCPPDSLADMDHIVGYERWLAYVDEARACYSERARQLGLRRPKGAMLLGLPGTGKSVVAMATARRMGLPLLKYDFAAVFSSLVGDSEARQRQALKRIKAQGPCVVLIDEADKALSGIVGGTVGDSGVGSRVLGCLLSWMATENHEALIILTANRIINPQTGERILPVETLRSGRLDSVYYTDLPTSSARARIFEAHLRRNGADWHQLPVELQKRLTLATEGFVGAEIEQVCVKAVRTAFFRRGVLQPTQEELEDARRTVTPVGVIDPENTIKIRDFCRQCATPVTDETEAPLAAPAAGRSIHLAN